MHGSLSVLFEVHVPAAVAAVITLPGIHFPLPVHNAALVVIGLQMGRDGQI